MALGLFTTSLCAMCAWVLFPLKTQNEGKLHDKSYVQGLSRDEYESKKEEVADTLVKRLEKYLPGLHAATVYREARLITT